MYIYIFIIFFSIRTVAFQNKHLRETNVRKGFSALMYHLNQKVFQSSEKHVTYQSYRTAVILLVSVPADCYLTDGLILILPLCGVVLLFVWGFLCVCCLVLFLACNLGKTQCKLR